MYIAVTGSRNNKDVYIYQSFEKKTGSPLLASTKSSESTILS